MKKAFHIQIAQPSELDRNHTILALPATWEELRSAFDRIDVKDFSDSCDITLAPDRNWRYLRDHIHTGGDLAELNLLAEQLAGMHLHQRAAFEGLVRMERRQYSEQISLARLINLAHNVDNCVVAFGVTTNEALGNFLYENDLLTDEEHEAARSRKSFSFHHSEYMATLGQKHRIEEGGAFTSHGYVENLSPIEEVYQPGTAKLPEPSPALATPRVDKGLFHAQQEEAEHTIQMEESL